MALLEYHHQGYVWSDESGGCSETRVSLRKEVGTKLNENATSFASFRTLDPDSEMSTPLRSRHSSSSLSGTPTPAGQGRGSGLGRVPGTPLGRVLAAEGLAVRSPRKIRHRSLPDK